MEFEKCWWLMPKDDGVLEFSVRHGCNILVSSIVSQSEYMIAVTGSDMVTGETTDVEVSIRDFTGVKRELLVLEKLTSSTTFCRTLEALMIGLGYKFYLRDQPAVQTSTPIAATKAEYVCPYKLEEQIEIMRHIHPDLESSGECVMLDSSNREWRKKAARAMGFVKERVGRSTFGGYFREQIAVACVSKRTYKVIKRVIENQKELCSKVNRGLFRGLSGLYEEELIYRTFRQFEDGNLSRLKMNSRFIEEKKSIKAALVGTGRTENEKLREEVKRLKEANQELREYIRHNGRMRTMVVADQTNRNEDETETVPVNHTTTVIITGEDSDFDDDVPSPTKRKARQVKYCVNYKPKSDEDTDVDSNTSGELFDPSWKRRKDESTSDSLDDDVDVLDTAMLEWDPERVDSIVAIVTNENKESDYRQIPLTTTETISSAEATIHSAPTTKATIHSAPTTKATIHSAPATKATIHSAPATKATIHSAPATKATIHSAPTTKATIHSAPATKATIHSAPTTKATIHSAPATKATIHSAPTTKATIHSAPATKATIHSAPATKATIHSAPTTKATIHSAPTTKSTIFSAAPTTSTKATISSSLCSSPTEETVPKVMRRTTSRSSISSTFKKGDVCQALFTNGGLTKWKQWFQAEVEGVLVNGALYRVKFQDGVKITVKRDEVKPL